MLLRIHRQLAKDFAELEESWPEDDLEQLHAEGIQARLPFEDDGRPRLLAVLAGFSLHADTHVHANDRQGLERLAGYAARGPIAQSRLERRDNGRYLYESRKGNVLLLTAPELVKRLLALLPPPKVHLTTFHGVLGPHSKWRSRVTESPSPVAEKQTCSLLRPGATGAGAGVPNRPRLDWASLQRRTFGVDVWTCRCGGRREVLAVISQRRTAEEFLRNLGLLAKEKPPSSVQAQAPPQLTLPLCG